MQDSRGRAQTGYPAPLEHEAKGGTADVELDTELLSRHDQRPQVARISQLRKAGKVDCRTKTGGEIWFQPAHGIVVERLRFDAFAAPLLGTGSAFDLDEVQSAAAPEAVIDAGSFAQFLGEAWERLVTVAAQHVEGSAGVLGTAGGQHAGAGPRRLLPKVALIDEPDLQGRRILLTGASSGIGRAVAEQLAALGARLTLVSRSEENLRETARRIPHADVLVVPGDVTKDDDRRRMLDRAADHFGGLDVVINNAGIASWAHFADSTEDILRQIMEVDFFAPAELIRAAIPILVEGQQPAIVNVASMCGRRAMPAWPEYSAAKYALCGLTEALRGELARFDIDILLIVPGLTRSDLSRNLLRNDGRLKIDFTKAMTPEQTAAGIVRALRKNKTETVLGSDARWMLFVNKFFPRLVDRLIARKVKKLYEVA